jgi:hypothetical protein
MARRHLFDNLAVANESLRRSRYRLAASLFALADSSQRMIDTRARSGCTRVELRDSRDNFNYGNAVRSAGERVPAGVGHQPGELPACEEPDRP